MIKPEVDNKKALWAVIIAKDLINLCVKFEKILTSFTLSETNHEMEILNFLSFLLNYES